MQTKTNQLMRTSITYQKIKCYKKNLMVLFVFSIAITICSCEKNNGSPLQGIKAGVDSQYGPIGKYSKWLCVSGDSLFADTLCINWYLREKQSPCDLHYYELSYPLWNCYYRDLILGDCEIIYDTLTIKDLDSYKKSHFIKIN